MWLSAACLAISDAISLSAVYWATVWIKHLLRPELSVHLYLSFYPFLLFFLGAFHSQDIYPGLFLHPAEEIKRIVHSTTRVLLICLALLFLWKNTDQYSRSILLSTWLGGTVAVIAMRHVVRGMFQEKTWWKIPAVVLGTGDAAQRLLHNLKKAKLGIRITGVLSEEPYTQWDASLPPVIGDFSAASLVVSIGAARYAILAMPDKTPSEITSIIQQHCRHFHHVLLVPDLPVICSMGVVSRDLGGEVGLEIPQRLSFPVPRFFKRLIDLGLGATALLVTAPFLIAIAALIKLTSPGPVLFGHQRYGRDGRIFRAWKFRSMVQDANHVLDEYLQNNPDAMREWLANHKLKKDPRVTPIGSLLRRFSLDELPQLFNVFLGHMSLVGPRPIVENEIERYADGYDLYRRVPPGITGLWQVSGRNNTTYPERVAFDRYYVRNWSVWLDLYILIRTFRVVLEAEGAY
jgi:Undecaprenyl-phosphate galactose phosphotransferase WbaP